MNWYLLAIKNYFNFKGRARRAEFWYFTLFNMAIIITLILIDEHILTPIFSEDFVLGGFYMLFILIPCLSISVRRLHDISNSGLHLFIYFIPFIGPFWLLINFISNGDKGRNKYGDDPKGYDEDFLACFGKQELDN